MSRHLVSAQDLGWSPVDDPIVGPLDLSIVEGEIVVVIGCNGAGKTSLLRLLSGLLDRSHGELAWEGRPYDELSRRELAQRIVYLPQLTPLRIPLTVGQFVRLARYPHRRGWGLAPSPHDDELTTEALRRLELLELRKRPLSELSGGERQRVSLAAAVAQGGQVWLLDEPTTHLDPRHQVEIYRLLRELHREGRTLIVTTHDLELAGRLATRIIGLTRGRIEAEGTPAEVLEPETLRRLFETEFLVERRDTRLMISLPG